jgi:cullin 1
VNLSREETNAFKDSIDQDPTFPSDINFSIKILATNSWPLKPPPLTFVLPKEIIGLHRRFNSFYEEKRSGRKLNWLWNHSKNELRTNYLNQRYLLLTSSYQMGVLLLYNDNDTLSLQEIVQGTGITKDMLVPVLDVLVKAKMLVCEETEQYDLNPCNYAFLACRSATDRSDTLAI